MNTSDWFVPFVVAMAGVVAMLVCVFILASELRQERKKRRSDCDRLKSEAMEMRASNARELSELFNKMKKDALVEKIADALDIYTRLGQPILHDLMVFTVLYLLRPGRRTEVRPSIAFVQEEPHKAVEWYESNIGPLLRSDTAKLGVF